ncbi:hypothetical protein BDR26DRAFT_892107 [Obelidium mucronatum]|nr:hypothetical protein BDR26DRAFT_892107 [Obelidium mucronatum]
MFLTIVDPNSDRVLYTSSLIKLSAMRQLQSNPTTTTGTTSSTSSTTTTTATTTTATPEINNLEFFKTHLSQDAINLFNLKSTSNSATSLLQTFKIFSFKHTVASSSLNDSEYHSLFIRSTDVLFVISRVPTIMGASDKILVPISNALTDRVAEESASLVDVAPLSASLSPPMSDASNEHGKSPIIGKRAFRPWEADELSAEKLVPPTLRQPQQERLKIPSISTILPPYHQMQDHKYRGMSASPLYQSRGEDPMSPLLAAVQRVATQSSPLHQFNSKPQYSNNPYSVNYKLPQSQQPPQHLQQPQQAHFIFPTPASTPKVYHITQQSTAPTSAPPRVQVQLPPSNYQQQQYQSNQYNESRLSSSQSPSTNPNHYVSSISTTGTAPSTESAPSMSSTTATASISSKAPNFHIQKTSSVPPSSESSLSPSHRQQQQQPHQLQTLQEEEFSVSKSRPLKPGHCKKCGTTASREWRKGPHGLKTLCNACGLRYKRKPWDIVNTFSTPSQLSAASGALTVGSGEGEGDQHSSDGGGYEVLQQRAKYSPGSSGVGVE